MNEVVLNEKQAEKLMEAIQTVADNVPETDLSYIEAPLLQILDEMEEMNATLEKIANHLTKEDANE